MRLYPMIHISNGRCFNPLAAGSMEKMNIYTNNPVKLAKLWENAGASRLHITDVDAATAGSPVHQDIIREIVDTVNIPIQYGGGLRTIKDIDDFMSMGISRVVSTTAAVQNINFVRDAIGLFGASKFAVGIDAIEGMVAIEGRAKISNYNALSLVNEMKKAGVTKVVYTDVIRGVASRRPSIENTKELLSKTSLDIILGGGITSLKDMEDISQLGVNGVLLGAALYEGKIDLAEAIEIYEKG